MINSVQRYRNISLPLSLCGGARSIRLREEGMLRELGYRELRKIFGLGKEEVRGDRETTKRRAARLVLLSNCY
jgi:hypothetical protein